ncbi:MAG: hypothetical protein ACE5F1_04225 [Planctomycetota bacterium]
MTDSAGNATHAYAAPNSTVVVAYFQDLNLVPRLGGGVLFTSSNGLRIDVANSPTRTILEEFDTLAQLDPALSSAVWGGGTVQVGKLGGSGKLGSFDVTVGRPLGKLNGRDAFEWNTDAMSYPLEKTLHGLEFWRKKLKDPKAVYLVIKDGLF